MGTNTQVERGPFFVVKKWYGNKKSHSYEVMSEKEIMGDESLTLASGHFDTRAGAEAALQKGILDGTYKS